MTDYGTIHLEIIEMHLFERNLRGIISWNLISLKLLLKVNEGSLSNRNRIEMSSSFTILNMDYDPM